MATLLRAAIRTDGTSAPPTADLAMVRGQDRRYDVRVDGIPAGLTLTKLVWTGKVAPGDADSAKHFQKVLTTATALATVGQITDTGTAGVARATASFVPADSASWPDLLVHQLWAVLSDGKPYCCLTGELASIQSIPLALPGGVAADRPPAAQSALVLAWDAKRGVVVGPAWQNGSTAGADTNDATYVAGPPERYTFDADDLFHWGDVLDATFAGSAGFAVLNAVSFNAADIAAALRFLVHKDGGTDRQWAIQIEDGLLLWRANYSADAANRDDFKASTAVAAGRHVVGWSWDPSLARASRTAAYLNGAAVAGTATSVGADGTIRDTLEPLQAGYGFATFPGVESQRALYIYNRPLTAQEHADNRAWIVNDGWA